MKHSLPLILASSSVFRQEQLHRLGLHFITEKPNFDETPLPYETAAETALRLSVGKARSLVKQFSRHLIIGADQIAWCNGRQLGKPMSQSRAKIMLSELSGERIEFYSAVCLLNTATGTLHSHTDQTIVHMRKLDTIQIEHYLAREPDAIYCAGGAKSEALGAALIQRIDSTDPNALIGLPIFKLLDFLTAEGIEIL